MEEELEDLNGGGEEVYLVEDEVEETYEEMEEILCSGKWLTICIA